MQKGDNINNCKINKYKLQTTVKITESFSDINTIIYINKSEDFGPFFSF